MAFPVVASTAVSGAGFGTTTFNATMPSGITAGDLLLASVFRSGSTTDLPTPSGWTEKLNFVDGSSGRFWLYAKVAAGSDALALDRSASGPDVACVMYRITDWFGDLAGVEAAGVNSGSGNPPSLTASWGSADNLWVAACGNFYGGADITTWPTGYSGSNISAYSSGNYNAVAMGTKNNATDTEDPGTGFGDLNSGPALVSTIVVRPVASSSFVPRGTLLGVG